MENKIDETIKKLFDVIQVKKNEIEKLDKPRWLTNCSFPLPVGGNVNIHTISEPLEIIKLYSYLINQEKSHNEALVELEVDIKLKISGYTVEEWKKDLKTRLGKIQIKSKQIELENLEKRLDNIISPEMKRKLELEEIEKMLNS